MKTQIKVSYAFIGIFHNLLDDVLGRSTYTQRFKDGYYYLDIEATGEDFVKIHTLENTLKMTEKTLTKEDKVVAPWYKPRIKSAQ